MKCSKTLIYLYPENAHQIYSVFLCFIFGELQMRLAELVQQMDRWARNEKWPVSFQLDYFPIHWASWFCEIFQALFVTLLDTNFLFFCITYWALKLKLVSTDRYFPKISRKCRERREAAEQGIIPEIGESSSGKKVSLLDIEEGQSTSDSQSVAANHGQRKLKRCPM